MIHPSAAAAHAAAPVTPPTDAHLLTVEDLYAAIAAEPLTSYRDEFGGRYVHTFWPTTHHSDSTDGLTDVAELHIRHEKYRRLYVATLSHSRVGFRHGAFVQQHSLTGPWLAVDVLTEPVTRFSLGRFTAFAARAAAMVAAECNRVGAQG